VEELESGIRVADPIRADDDHRNDEIVDDQVATPIAAVEVQPRLTKTSEDVVLLEKQHVNDQGEPIDVARAEQDRNLTSESDLSDTNRKIWVVTTAAMPWRTGTSLNPLMRALYLTRGRPKHSITLVIPWLEDIKSRKKLYGDALCFDDGGKQAQEQWIREYCRERCKCEGTYGLPRQVLSMFVSLTMLFRDSSRGGTEFTHHVLERTVSRRIWLHLSSGRYL
jgi:hypothetical protein